MKRDQKNKHSNMSSSSPKKLTQTEKSHIEELLKSTLQEYAIRQTKTIKDKEDIAQKLTAIIGEYIGAFMLIGYDAKGDPFNMLHAPTQLDIDAINTSLNKLVFNMGGNNQ